MNPNTGVMIKSVVGEEKVYRSQQVVQRRRLFKLTETPEDVVKQF